MDSAKPPGPAIAAYISDPSIRLPGARTFADRGRPETLTSELGRSQAARYAWRYRVNRRSAHAVPFDLGPLTSEAHMNPRTGLYTLIALNIALLALGVVQQLRPAFAQGDLQVLRGRGLEIVDAQGRVRASISVLPPSKATAGEEQSETVLLRLITERGRPTVKIGSSEPTSGLSFAGPTGTRDSYLILQTKGKTSSLKLRNEDGHEQIVTP
jgi:hypothetical protein